MLGGKVALVTGGSRGIGREISKILALEGAFVIVNYSGNESAAQETVREIADNGGQAETYKCNVGSFPDVKEMIDTIVKKHKTIDIIVNNAGITKDNLLLKMTEQDFDEVININLKGCFNIVKNAVLYMLKQKSGKIINISSICGVTGNVGQINYCASKAGVIGLTKSLARELACRGITVNAVAPGFIETDMTASLANSVTESMMENIPLKKFGKVSDVAEMVAYLACEKADYITGQVIEVNGGMNM